MPCQVIKAREWQPVIFFAFARKELEQMALSLKTFDFNTEEEKEEIGDIYTAAVQVRGGKEGGQR